MLIESLAQAPITVCVQRQGFERSEKFFQRKMAATTNAKGIPVGLVKLGSQGLCVSAQGFGCAGLMGRYGPMNAEDELISLIHHAVSRGVTFLDTSDSYGPFISEIIVGKALKGIRRQAQLATKFGGRPFLDGKSEIRGDPAHVRASCEASLNRLGVDCIDLYYQHRVDTKVPIEVTVGEMKKLVEEGKVKFIGLSEASAETIRRAHAVHPVTAVQIEWSLWNRSAEKEIIPTCRELGIGIVAYSPLGRGFLASGPKIVQTFADTDIRKTMKRFQVGNLEKNKEAFEGFSGIATRKGCTPAQLALAWVHSRGKDVVPIPGTSKIKFLDENIDALSVTVEDKDLMEIESTMASASTGETDLDLEKLRLWKFANTPPLSSYKNTASC